MLAGLFLLLFLPFNSHCYEFTIKLKRSHEVCFKELTFRDMFTFISFESLHEKAVLSATVKEDGSSDHVFKSKKMEQKFEIAFTTIYDNGVIFCVKSGNIPVTVRVIYKSGPEARDYTMLAKNTHISATESMINRVHDELALFHRLQVNGSKTHDKAVRLATRSYTLLRGFFIFNCLMIVLSTVFSARKFKKFFISKKLM